MGARGATGYVLGRGAGSAANWWEAGGATNCVAAYQPKGAASLAASYINLPNPGVFDAAPGVAPTFDTATGWTFAAASSTYLTTGIVPAATTWTYLVKFTDGKSFGEQSLIGARVESPSRQIVWLQAYPATATVRQYRNGGASPLNVATAVYSGVMGMANNTAYLDGTSCGTISTGSVANIVGLYIGATNNNGTAQSFLTAKIQAIAIYNATLSAAQVTAISAAMQAI